MFKRHVYTCPDVIYIMNRNRRINHASIGVALILVGGLYVYGNRVQKDYERQIEDLQHS